MWRMFGLAALQVSFPVKKQEMQKQGTVTKIGVCVCVCCGLSWTHVDAEVKELPRFELHEQKS